MNAPLIDVREIGKSYGAGEGMTVALSSVTLRIDRGEFVAIMGPSGSGKSTLMHILGFLDVPTKGSYRFEGRETSLMKEEELASVRVTKVSFVFQSFNLLPRTTVLENIMLPLLYHPDIPADEREERALSAARAVGLEERLKHLSNQLSGGQQQRVAIARSLVTNPQVIFADEPTGNLDSASGIHVMLSLQKLHAEGRTIILVTHEQTTAQHAERIIRIRDGAIESDTKDFRRMLASHASSLK